MTARKVFPGLSIHDSRYGRLFDSIQFPNFSLEHTTFSPHFSNFVGLLVRQLGEIGGLSSGVSIQTDGIVYIIFVGVPAKITQMTVKSIRIIVTCLHPIGTGANEGFEDKAVAEE